MHSVGMSEAFIGAPRRIVVVGTSCSGKSTLARSIAGVLAVKYVELDFLFWEENWRKSDSTVFRTRVSQAVEGDGWVVDGNYSAIRDLIWSRAQIVVWLDYPLAKILLRFFKRSLGR